MERTRDPDFAARLFGTRPEHALALLRAAWPAAVGPELARRTEVVALDRGLLRIKVPDAGWQKNLQRIRGDLLSRLRSVAGGVSPYALGFVVGTVAPAPEPASEPAPTPSPGPPPSVPPGLAEAARSIPDAEIRARFEAAAARYLARFAGAQAAGSGAGPGSTAGSGSTTG